ncbi:MAG TPA: DNA polymerase ligase N-terminal domain-containing protein [Mycobacteriales bacterium]|nr:DNA polymerase ligase N-terminal domain-containing protein [Mycobacteriales bacterium]
MSLDSYRSKRDAAKTPEPMPEWDVPDVSVDHTGDEQAGRGETFVVQEHHATALHWDLRIERDGVLVSWAVPKGIPLDPARNHLAKQTEDHPKAYAEFAGDIPKGEYGGGTMSIWDSGTYELQKWRSREVMLVLHGTKVDGRYVLFRTRDRDWMLHRMDPPPAGWSALPEGLRPMQPTNGSLPPDEQEWTFEVRWSGRRVLIAVDGGRLHVEDADGADITAGYPELRGLGLQLGSRPVLLDAELVVLDGAGRVDPAGLKARGETVKPGRALLRGKPVQLMIGDLLHREGESLLDQEYHRRRAALEELDLQGPNWQVPPTFPGEGAAVLEAARTQGLAGIVAKKLDSSYRPGRRTRKWLVIS